MSDSHSEGIQQKAFCALRTDKCKPCGNAYQDNCTPSPAAWEGYYFLQGTKMEVQKKFEAHHLLCIASVTAFVAKKKEIIDVVRQTEWCINATTNMFAMPLWGHTLSWYCDLESGDLLSRVKAPPFVNIPQHDYDHNSEKGYKSETDKKMEELANQIEEKAEESHEAAVKALKKQLDTWSEKFRTTLQSRGSSRSGGTHKAWKKGFKQPDSDWYLPFSMADDGNAEKRTFPLADDEGKVAKKIARLVAAYGRWT
jgi:hypothetical protein